MTLSQAGSILLILSLGHQGNGPVETRQDTSARTQYQSLNTGPSGGYSSATHISEVDD